MDERLQINAPRNVPIIGGMSKKEKQEASMKALLQKPEAYAKLNALAEELNTTFNETVKIITDIRAGATFRDSLTGKLYAYEYFALPFEHDVRTKVIMELAKKPLEEFTQEHYFLIYDKEANPSPRFIMGGVDFCKYFACQIFVLVDANIQQEKDFLKDIEDDKT
jgi:hypothetical protein